MTPIVLRGTFVGQRIDNWTNDDAVSAKYVVCFLCFLHMRSQVKVHRYWPAKQPANIGSLVAEMTNEMSFEDYTMREIKLTNTQV